MRMPRIPLLEPDRRALAHADPLGEILHRDAAFLARDPDAVTQSREDTIDLEGWHSSLAI